MDYYREKFDNLESTLKAKLEPNGYLVHMAYDCDMKKRGVCHLRINGKTKNGEDAYSSVRFDIYDLQISMAGGNQKICNWLADKFFKRPPYDMFNLWYK
jgi:hypothetical protein